MKFFYTFCIVVMVLLIMSCTIGVLAVIY